MSNITEQKNELRKKLRGEMRALSKNFAKAESDKICKQAISLDEYAKADTVFAYVGVDWEIDTTVLLNDILNSGKTLVLPLCMSKGIMEARIIKDLSELKTGSYGLLEPDENTPVCSPEDIDLAIVPCVGCDKNKKRLGQGGGFYDRFMSVRNFKTAALCREIALINEVPCEPWDLPVDYVILPDRII